MNTGKFVLVFTATGNLWIGELAWETERIINGSIYLRAARLFPRFAHTEDFKIIHSIACGDTGFDLNPAATDVILFDPIYVAALTNKAIDRFY